MVEVSGYLFYEYLLNSCFELGIVRVFGIEEVKKKGEVVCL